MRKSSIVVLLMMLFSACSFEQTNNLKEESNLNLNKEEIEKMNSQLTSYINSFIETIEVQDAERMAALEEISEYITEKLNKNESAQLTFICTHNSRRSHLCQIWAATAAVYFGLEDVVKTFSGGTEVTAFNPRAVAAVERAGFWVEKPEGENPIYTVKYYETSKGFECFSKKYDSAPNPSTEFVAVMTCSDADQNCPFIPGAALRVPIPYIDPKEADGTSQEAVTYDERCLQIAKEMFYMMSKVEVN